MNPLVIALGVVAGILIAAVILTHLLPSRGRHSNTLGPAHNGAGDGPEPEIEYGWPLNTPAARAVLVDLAAALRQDATNAVLQRDIDHARNLNRYAARLESVLRRWDIYTETA